MELSTIIKISILSKKIMSAIKAGNNKIAYDVAEEIEEITDVEIEGY